MPRDNWLLYLTGLFASLAVARGEIEIYHSNQSHVIRGEIPGSLFGYSIAYQEQLKKLVIGSPKEDPIGQVHLCPIEKAGKCEHVYRGNITTSDSKYNFWFGATVNAGKNFLMACAPRYITTSRTNKNFVSTYGHCYHVKTPNAEAKPSDTNLLLEFAYTITDDKIENYHLLAYGKPSRTPEQLSDTFGLSSYVFDKKIIFVGSPAMSIGRVFKYDQNTNTPSLISVINENLEKKVSYNFALVYFKCNSKEIAIPFYIICAALSVAFFVVSYGYARGYSITSGFFQSSSSEIIAISTPYGTIGYGRVYFYDYKSEALSNNTWVDPQELNLKVGSLFGACLASLKQGREKKSALLVGAPAFAKSGYDIGAVYIYTFERNKNDFTTYSPQLIKELLPVNNDNYGGRFGASIVTIGDFNNDDIPEVAVAAPFENDGRGAVYLYSGKLLLSKDTASRVPYMQLLRPEASMLSYGWSLNALNDADDNGCNELAIGAPFSESVTFMRCMASVKVEFVKVEFPDDNITLQFLNLTDADRAFSFKSCLKIRYNPKPRPAKIETNVNFVIKITHPDITLEAGENNGTIKSITVPLKSNLTTKPICHENLKVMLPKEADYDRKITFDLSLSLVENPLLITDFNANLVLLNGGTKYHEQFDGPKLPASNVTFTVRTTLKEDYVIGSTDEEQLVIYMENSGQTAHGPCVRTRLTGVTVSQMPRLCYLANGELECKLPKLQSGQNETKIITLSMKSLTSSNDRLELSSELRTSDCSIPNGQNDTTVINLTKDANVMIKNSSIPGFLVNAKEEELNFGGKIIEHVYKITNNGFTVWRNITCEIVLPPQVKIEKVTIKPVIENCVIVNHTANCPIKELGKNKPIDVRIQMKIEPDSSFVAQIKSGKATVDTKLSLKLSDTMLVRITTIVSLWEAPKVPLWMIIVASLVGILIIVILLWVLHECGCLRRQNKQKLKELKKDVHRQTMRKSMMLRQSVIEVVSQENSKGERERLINVPEEDVVTNDIENQDHQSTPVVKDTNGQHRKDIDKLQTQQAQHLINVQPVKEICVDDNDPARVAFNAQLAKALAKGIKSVVTKAEVHGDNMPL